MCVAKVEKSYQPYVPEVLKVIQMGLVVVLVLVYLQQNLSIREIFFIFAECGN